MGSTPEHSATDSQEAAQECWKDPSTKARLSFAVEDSRYQAMAARPSLPPEEETQTGLPEESGYSVHFQTQMT